MSVLTKLPNGTYAYKSVQKKLLISTSNKNIPATGLNYILKTDNPGEYELVIKNSEEMDNIRRLVLNIEKIRKSLHWSPSTSLDSGLEKTYKWFNSNISAKVK